MGSYEYVDIDSLFDCLSLIADKKSQFAYWLIRNCDSENKVIGAYRQMAKEACVSLDTVRTVMRELQDADVVKKIQIGVYQINPSVVFKGEGKKRMAAVYKYMNAGKESK